MKVNTDNLRSVSQSLSQSIQYMLFEDINLNSGHAQILNHLPQLSNYFNQGAIVIETNEQKTSSFFQSGKSNSSFKTDWNIVSIFQKKEKPVRISETYEYSFGQASSNIYEDYLQAGASLNAIDFLAEGKCEFYLWKDKLFNPKALLDGSLSLSLLSGSAYTKIGTSNINAYAKGKVDLGVVYGNASAIICQEEQTFSFGFGAALVRGKASLAFNLFGASITLTGRGSIGSTELNMEYSHKNREWIVGTDLGFIAGLGFEIKVVY